MNTAQFIEDMIKLIRRETRASIVDGIIDSVDESNYTCSVKNPITEKIDYNIPLRVLIGSQSSFIEIPKQGSACVICFRDLNPSRPQLLEVHECSKILSNVDSFIFNGGENGGMVLVNKLVDSYNDVVSDIERVKTALNTNCANGVPLIPVGSWIPETTTKDNEYFENPKIKQ